MNNSPQSTRRFMDFAPRGKRPSAPRPATPRPAMHSVQPGAQPVTVKRTPRPVVAPRPAPRPTPPRHIVHEHVESTTILYPSSQHRSQFTEEDAFLDIEDSGLGIIEDLGTSTTAPSTTSPFINTDKIDKRPLSSHLPEEKSAEPASEKRLPLLSRKEKPTPSEQPSKRMGKLKRKKSKKSSADSNFATGSASKGNTLALIIAIILTVILGAAVGAVAYLAFFQ